MYRSYCGATLSILTLVTIITFGSLKASELFSMQDYKVQMREQLEYYHSDESFGARDGFMIAANLIDYSSQSSLNDPTIGSIAFMLTDLNMDPDYEGDRYKARPLETRPCSQSDFAYSDEDSHTSWFY